MGSFLGFNLLALVLSNLASVVNHGTSMFLARSMPVEDYGLFYSIQSLNQILFPIFTIIPYAVTQTAIEYQGNPAVRQLVLRRLLRVMGLCGVVVTALLFLGIGPLGRFMKIPRSVPLVIYAVTFIPMIFQNFAAAILQGLLMFRELSLRDLVLNVAKFLLMVLFVRALKLGASGAMLGELMGTLAVTAWILWTIAPRMKLFARVEPVEGGPSLRRTLLLGAPLAFTAWVIGLATTADVSLVKHLFSDEQAGIYAAAATVGRISFFFSGILVTLLFPQVLEKTRRGESSLGALVTTGLLTAVSSLAIGSVIAFFARPALVLLFGERYGAGAEILSVVAFTMALLAVANVLFTFFLAKRIYGFLYPSFVCIVATLIAVAYLPCVSPEQVARRMFMGALVLVFANIIFVLLRFRGDLKLALRRVR